MADLDTRSKRASSVGIALIALLAPVLPDGTLDQSDRQHGTWSYSGILAGDNTSIASPTPFSYRRRGHR